MSAVRALSRNEISQYLLASQTMAFPLEVWMSPDRPAA
jgi:hypothetical protein